MLSPHRMHAVPTPLQTRLTKARTLSNPQKTLKLLVQPKAEEELECPKGSQLYSLYWCAWRTG